MEEQDPILSASTALMLPATDDWRELAAAANDALDQLAPRSRRVYRLDLKAFLAWMIANELTPTQLKRTHMIAYREHLLATYERASAARMIASVRSVLQEWALYTERTNPAVGLKPIQTANESTHVALTKPQVRQLLRAIDTSQVSGLRNLALILLLVRTGLRRFECSALNIGDLRREAGHIVAYIWHGKGDDRRMVKIPPDVYKAIQAYLEAANRINAAPDAPLFVQIRRGGHVQPDRLGEKAIETLVKVLGQAIGVPELTPHGLRATFITLALEAGAPLWMVQYAAGHAKPETTERYHKRKKNLDHNAVDYLHDVTLQA